MIFRELQLNGAYIIELETIEDERGFFARVFTPIASRTGGGDTSGIHISAWILYYPGTGRRFGRPDVELPHCRIRYWTGELGSSQRFGFVVAHRCEHVIFNLQSDHTRRGYEARLTGKE